MHEHWSECRALGWLYVKMFCAFSKVNCVGSLLTRDKEECHNILSDLRETLILHADTETINKSMKH